MKQEYKIVEKKRIYEVYRQDGLISWETQVNGKWFTIEEYQGKFLVTDWFRDNEFDSMAAAVADIKSYEATR